MTDEGLIPVIKVVFWASATVPGVVADEDNWPYTAESLEKIGQWTGMPAAEAKAKLEATGEIAASMWHFRLVYQLDVSDAEVAPHEPCNCPLCVFVATRGWLEEGHLDCHDYPRYEGAGRCSDPFAIECRCPGTAAEGGPCEACGAYDDPEQVAKIVAGFRASQASEEAATRSSGSLPSETPQAKP